MKVLIIHYRYFISGGPERYMFNIINKLEDEGHEVIPFSVRNKRNVPSKYECYFAKNIGNSDEIFINTYPKTIQTYMDLIGREFYSFKVKKALLKLIRDTQPDVCYLLVYKRTLSPSVIDACKRHNIPVINRISDYNTVCGASSLYRDNKYCQKCITNDKNLLKYSCLKGSRLFSTMRFVSIKLHKFLKIDRKIDNYICTNQLMADAMKRYGYAEEKINVIPTFFNETETLKTIGKTNHINQSCIRFLFIGNVDESKGIYDLLTAVFLMKHKIDNFHFSIVGGLHSDENDKIIKIINNNMIKEHISFVPFQNSGDVYKYYLKSNVTVIPSRWVENLPNTLIESIYFQRPVVVPAFGSFLYTTDSSVAFYYKVHSAEDLSNVLLDLCMNPDKIALSSNQCSDYYNKYYSTHHHMNKLLPLLTRENYENN